MTFDIFSLLFTLAIIFTISTTVLTIYLKKHKGSKIKISTFIYLGFMGFICSFLASLYCVTSIHVISYNNAGDLINTNKLALFSYTSDDGHSIPVSFRGKYIVNETSEELILYPSLYKEFNPDASTVNDNNSTLSIPDPIYIKGNSNIKIEVSPKYFFEEPDLYITTEKGITIEWTLDSTKRLNDMTQNKN